MLPQHMRYSLFFFLEYKFNNYTHNKRAVFLKPFVYFLV